MISFINGGCEGNFARLRRQRLIGGTPFYRIDNLTANRVETEY